MGSLVFPGSLWNPLGQRHGGAGQVAPDRRQDRVTRAHGFLRFSRYHWRNVCFGDGRQLAVLAPGVERVVEQEPRQVHQGRLPGGLGGVEGRRVGEGRPQRPHADPLGERQQPFGGDHAAPLVDLVGDVDLDRAHLGARPAERRVEGELAILRMSKPGSRMTPIGPE